MAVYPVRATVTESTRRCSVRVTANTTPSIATIPRSPSRPTMVGTLRLTTSPGDRPADFATSSGTMGAGYCQIASVVTSREKAAGANSTHHPGDRSTVDPPPVTCDA